MSNKSAIVTGCSTGIGRATAVELSKRGYEVTATARRPEQLAALDVARTVALDVDDDASVAAAVANVGPVDVLVNNAGFGIDGAVETVPLTEVRRMFETNFFGAARMIQAFLPSMRERGEGASSTSPPLQGWQWARSAGTTQPRSSPSRRSPRGCTSRPGTSACASSSSSPERSRRASRRT